MKNKNNTAITREKNFNPKDYIMLITVFFWSSTFIAGKIAVNEFPIFTLVFFRFFIATIAIFPLLLKMDIDWKIHKDEIPILLFLGFVGMFGHHSFFFLGLKYTSVVNSSLIASTTPLITTFLASIILFEKIKLKYILAAIISLSGVILIITNGNLSELTKLHFNKGDIIILISAFFWAIYSIYSKKGLDKCSTIKLTTYVFLFGSLFSIPFMFIFEKPLIIIQNASISAWGSILFMSIFPSVIGYLLNQVSIKQIGPSKTNMFMNLNPLFSIIMAFFILGEKIYPITILASALIIIGVLLATYNPNKTNKKRT